jgi:hypothetical protein
MSRNGSYEAEYGSGTTPLQEWELAGEAEQYEGEGGRETEAEYEGEDESEALEYELTNQLLAVRNEAELDQFLGGLIKSAGTFLNSGVGKAVGGVLKNVAKAALPVAGAALGSALLPGVGTALGGKLGSLAGGLLEVGETETMSEDEAEFEAAHRFVEFGRATSRNAGLASPRVPPNIVARAAAVAAARKHAPGLVRPRPQSFRDRREPRRAGAQAGARQRRTPGQDGGQPRRRAPASDRGQPRGRPSGWDGDRPRHRPRPPWQTAPWQPVPWQPLPWPPGQWQPSDAWAGWAGGPGGPGAGPEDTSGRDPGPADDDGPDPGAGPGAGGGGAGGPADDDGAADESGGFEF